MFPDRKEVFLRPDGETLKAEEIEKLFSPLGFFTARLDGAGVKDKRGLLAALASALRFPAYFGYNWDALLDCLRSLPEFMNARGYALIIERSDLFLKDSPAELADFEEIVETAAEFLLEKYKLRLKVFML
ncbi:MAG: barstar family protein [Elusimicrobiales bacterium]|jgi:RNAse (barnase) inhibitor barstar